MWAWVNIVQSDNKVEGGRGESIHTQSVRGCCCEFPNSSTLTTLETLGTWSQPFIQLKGKQAKNSAVYQEIFKDRSQVVAMCFLQTSRWCHIARSLGAVSGKRIVRLLCSEVIFMFKPLVQFVRTVSELGKEFVTHAFLWMLLTEIAIVRNLKVSTCSLNLNLSINNDWGYAQA